MAHESLVQNRRGTVASVTTHDDFGGWPVTLGALTAGTDITSEHAESVLDSIFEGAATEAQIAAFITALRQKGETVSELSGLVRAMRKVATPLNVADGAIDIVGMGGSPSRRKAALNVSTMASFVAAGAGAVVCKHGNRKASSTSGSFDLLEALGVNFDVPPQQLEAIIAETGIGFAFARTYHPSMRHVGPVRVQLGIPTVFNALGPLANPARVTRQVVGVADAALGEHMALVLAATGSVHSWVVTGDGSLDEISPGPTTIHELRDGEIRSLRIDSEDYGIAPPPAGALDGGDAEANAAIAHRLFAGEKGPVRDIVSLNAAAGLVVAGVASDMADGLARAHEALDSGAAAGRLEALIEASNS